MTAIGIRDICVLTEGGNHMNDNIMIICQI